MSDRAWRIRPRVVLVACVLTTAALSLVFVASRRFLRGQLALELPADRAAALAADFDLAFLAAAVLAIAATAGLALLLASRAARAVLMLRRGVLARASGGSLTGSGSRIAELGAIERAVERMAADLENVAADLRVERDDAGRLVESVSEGLVLVSDGGRVLEVNGAARTLLGLPDACRGRLLISMVRHPALRSVLERAQEEMPLAEEIAFDERRLLVHVRPTDGGEPGRTGVRTVLTFVDLTELRRLEGVRRDFVANVSHELKTPLTSIQGYVETLLSDDLPRDTERQFLDVVRANTQRLRSLVDDLLDLSRLDSGGWRPVLQPVDAAAVARAAWDELEPRARTRGILFECAEGAGRVHADPDALRQILLNLFDNAIRHTPPGGRIRVDIAPAGAASEDLVTVSVEDTGAGIPAEALPRIFERFFRVDPARSRSEGGTGLGLSIVKHLTEAMGGDVSAASTIGRGTTIRVRLRSA